MKNRLKELDWSSKIMKQNNKKDNPCKFCNINDDSYGKDFSEDEYIEFKLYRVKDDYYIYNYSAYSDPTSDWFETYSGKINYCPICGRKLAENEN